jgi:hypothetical protein
MERVGVPAHRRFYDRHGQNAGYVLPGQVIVIVLSVLQGFRPSNIRDWNVRWIRANAGLVIDMVVQEVLFLRNHPPLRVRLIFGGVIIDWFKVCILERIRDHLSDHNLALEDLSPSLDNEISDVLIPLEIIRPEQWRMNDIRNRLLSSFNPQRDDPLLNDDLRHVLVHYVTDLAVRCARGDDNLPPLPEQLHHLRWEEDD